MEHKEIKAETWLSANYPSQKEWVARQQGIFKRNYVEDLRTCNAEEQTVELSRNGLYEILPDGLFFTGRELSGIDKSDFEWTDKVLKQRVQRIKTVFLPFDSSFFNHSLALEHQLNETLDHKKEVLDAFFGNDFSNERNPYIRKMAFLLPQAAHIRGNYRYLCQAIGNILGYKVHVTLRPDRVRFVVNRPNLDKATLLRYLDELKPFFAFVEEWFVPFELRCEFKVRDYTRDDRLQGANPLMLDYNATLGNKPQQTPETP